MILAEPLFGLHRLSRSVNAIWCQNRDISRCEPSQSLHVVEAKVNQLRQKTNEWKRAKIEDMPATNEQDEGSPGVDTGAVQQRSRTSASIRGRRSTDRKLSGFSPGKIFIQTGRLAEVDAKI